MGYTIKPGDTLWDIAKSNNTTVADIQKANPNIKDPDVIQAGQTITIPGADNITGASSAANITGASSAANTSTEDSTQPTAQAPQYEYSQDIDLSQYSYDPSTNQAYQEALAALKAAQSQIPTYKGTYDAQLDEIYNQIINRDKFSYNLNEDALYNQYKDQYIGLGKMAMMDTMGQAAGMTGGYGNSYANTAGNQAYQAYLQQLNDIVPELYGMARDQYNQEGQDLLNKYSVTGDMADTEYGRYQDDLSQWWHNVDYLTGRADTEYSKGFENWYTGYQNAYQAERDAVEDSQWAAELSQRASEFSAELAYKQSRDAIEDARYEKEYQDALDQYYAEFEYQKERDKVSDEQWQKTFDSKNTGGSSSSGGGGSTGDSGGGTESGGSKYDNGSLSSSQVKELQSKLGVEADGYFGPNSQAAAKKLGYDSADAAYKALIGGSGGGVNFSGTTYSEAVAFMKSKGVPNSNASGIMTKSEWSRRKSSYKSSGTGGTEVKNYDSYEEYLADFVEYAIETYA